MMFVQKRIDMQFACQNQTVASVGHGSFQGDKDAELAASLELLIWHLGTALVTCRSMSHPEHASSAQGMEMFTAPAFPTLSLSVSTTLQHSTYPRSSLETKQNQYCILLSRSLQTTVAISHTCDLASSLH